MRLDDDPELSALLEKVRSGDKAARDRLIEKIYPELRRIARMLMAGERKTHTLGQTGSALVSLYWLKLQAASANSLESIQDLDHLLNFSIRNMRQILVDYSRRYGNRRGDPSKRASLEDVVLRESEDSLLNADLLELDAVLDELEQDDPKRAKALEYKHFGGLSIPEGAAAMQVSETTYRRYCEYGEALIKKRLMDRAKPAQTP